MLVCMPGVKEVFGPVVAGSKPWKLRARPFAFACAYEACALDKVEAACKSSSVLPRWPTERGSGAYICGKLKPLWSWAWSGIVVETPWMVAGGT
jgi:hypothetical protein